MCCAPWVRASSLTCRSLFAPSGYDARLCEMNDEYTALRAEILEWQSRRMGIASGTMILVTAVLGWIVQHPKGWAWTTAAAILLVAIASAALLTWIFGLNAIRIGSYVQVFHEEAEHGRGWEGRNAEFRGPAHLSLNSGLGLVYSALGGIAVTVPYLVATRPATTFSWVVFALALAAAAAGVSLVLRPWSRRSDAVERWRALRTRETNSA